VWFCRLVSSVRGSRRPLRLWPAPPHSRRHDRRGKKLNRSERKETRTQLVVFNQWLSALFLQNARGRFCSFFRPSDFEVRISFGLRPSDYRHVPIKTPAGIHPAGVVISKLSNVWLRPTPRREALELKGFLWSHPTSLQECACSKMIDKRRSRPQSGRRRRCPSLDSYPSW
jgi:hypothetical protein